MGVQGPSPAHEGEADVVVVLMLLQPSDGIALARNLGLHPRPPPLKVAAPQLLILILQQQQQQNDDELLHLQGSP